MASAVDSLNALVDDFVAVANVSCDISLTDQQIDDVTQIFNVVLPVFVVCFRRMRAVVQRDASREQAIAAAVTELTPDFFALTSELNRCSRRHFHAHRKSCFFYYFPACFAR